MTPPQNIQSFDFNLLINLCLIILFTTCAITDLTHRKIYNIQTYSTIICGLSLNYLAGGWTGMFRSFCGLLIGSSLLFVFFLLGGVGGGDIKFLGAIGALKGSNFTIWTMFYTGLIGGAMAFAIIIWKGTFRKTIINLLRYLRHPFSPKTDAEKQGHQYLPYGLAISFGCLWALFTL